jgi:MFS family permease
MYLLPIGLASAYLGRMLQGMGEACLYTGAATWVVEAAGIERSGRALGLLSSAIWGGVSAGPVVGQYIGSFQHAAMLQVVTAMLALIVVSLIPEDYHFVHHEAKRGWLPRRLVAPGFAVGLVNVHYPVIAGFLILHLANHGNSGPAAFAAYALLIMLSRFFLGGLPDRIHPAITFNAGISIMAIGLFAIALGPPPFVAVGSAALLGFGFSFPWSAVAATVMRNTLARERGSAISILSAFYDLFVGTSSFAAGIVAHRFGYSAAFFLAVGSLVLAAIVGRIVFHPESSIYHSHSEVPVEAETLAIE